jgi:hypothetical protein
MKPKQEEPKIKENYIAIGQIVLSSSELNMIELINLTRIILSDDVFKSYLNSLSIMSKVDDDNSYIG